MVLEEYNRKRNFTQTREPHGETLDSPRQRFVVQEHHASRLHFDFRLEMAGVSKSWAVPKGPSMDARDKRLAVEVEDHPVSYIGFEGRIGAGNYGAGEVRVWDSGTYTLIEPSQPLAQLAAGRLSFRLQGKKLRGEFTLVRMAQQPKQWLLIKKRDGDAKAGWKLETILAVDASPRPTAKKRVRKKPSE